MLTFRYGEMVTRLRGPGKDQYGDPLPGDPASTAIGNCALWPRDANAAGGNENTDFRDTVITGLMLLTPPGTDVQPTDRFTARGDTWEVDGEPAEWRSPLTGTDVGVLVALKRVEG